MKSTLLSAPSVRTASSAAGTPAPFVAEDLPAASPPSARTPIVAAAASATNTERREGLADGMSGAPEGPAAKANGAARWASFSSPLGEVSVAVDAAGRVVSLAFGGIAALRSRAPSYRYVNDAGAVAAARREVEAYFADSTARFSIALAPEGTAFQQRVWAALREIPAGQTRSYGQLAVELGTSPRAIGRANATNPVCLLIPCHRVVGTDGSLTGYAFGEDLKRKLLIHEQALPLPPHRLERCSGSR
ncbi:MAG TPA: methylated-DNA--[protein]-cysteine S-methyltransferase [Opitutaceae bacterium]|jgi:methylated-DNA-[protein]-cysteine S-methyltransferase|nr:methylated-DNA--[protein]-cysteine S-methyltransferase [Opitutaceae bacterium]